MPRNGGNSKVQYCTEANSPPLSAHFELLLLFVL